ncbi:hypothetical protein FK529_02995 [Tsukamurella asaccharolytica]|mgnify:CR=1 FL=1|uniref:Aromatic-ring-hydroxylating dioxygenase subunit beta n=1 Tax=Tsukamurella asaccharolytica TaxID=2592067 RepID=A0A5C5REZ3_9ACTN|nr:aromatic-ring-hydroxylating dioxygenase subunit beta [Tsukamurella asaccharolytica]TWS21567.1 hypothetical protein FK529_02995 [Tsukamurella asaccharolytica]
MSDLMFADPRVLRAIELAWHEAKLLDDKNYEAWQELFTDEGLYIVPIDPETDDFAGTLNMIYDDKRMRALRVQRMIQGYSPAAVAAARTARIVSRFSVTSVDDHRVVLRGAQLLSAFKRNEFITIGADVEYIIALRSHGDRIERKVVRLLDSEDATRASGYLV